MHHNRARRAAPRRRTRRARRDRTGDRNRPRPRPSPARDAAPARARRRRMKTDAAPAAAAPDAPKTLYQGVERDGFGMRLLTRLGWREGRGLGKNQDGIARHIHARKRQVGTGVGADARNDASGANAVDWTMNTVAFDDVLRSLNRTHSAEELERAANAEKASSSDEDEDEAAKTKTRDEAKKRKMTKEEKKAAKKAAKRAKTVSYTHLTLPTTPYV